MTLTLLDSPPKPYTWQHEDFLGTDPTFPHSPSDPAWGTPIWPARFKGFYPHQVKAALEILDHFNAGTQVVFLNAPTGSGKTCLAEMVRRLLGVPQSLYVANTKSLQSQFMRDFGTYAKNLAGRANYPTLDKPELFSAKFQTLNAGDCTKSKQMLPACGNCPPDKVSATEQLHCANCHVWYLCPYEVAKREALSATLAVTNTSYFVTEANGPGNFSARPFVIVDEADTLEPILLGHIELHLPEKKCRELDISPPTRKTVESSWVTWLEDEGLPKVSEALRKATDPPPESVAKIRNANYLTRLHAKLLTLGKELEAGNIVYDGYQSGDIRFKPIRVNTSAPNTLWKHGEKWLLMSATFIDPTQDAENLGLDLAEIPWELVNVPSTFPPKNRPIFIKPIASMTFKEKETSWPLMVEGVKRVLKKHPNARTIIHTVSYALTEFMREGLRDCGRPVLTYGKASERDQTLARYRAIPGAVMLAPSMDRGVDLAEHDEQVCIIIKMPVPNTKDKRVEKRLYAKGGQMWLLTQTLSSLVQMTGRHVRSRDQVGFSYVLDKQFVTKTWPEGRRFLPSWWVEAIDWTGGGI